jgi:hypothetical protein
MSTPIAHPARPLVGSENGRVGRSIRFTLGLLDRIGSRRKATVVGLAAGVILARLALLNVLPIPHPWVADEFSYLLGADTFASGRLTSPTPHHWRSFETVHVLMQPTYASKYPPGQAAFLALGQVVFGNPYWGVVLSMALFCAATCWMLQVLVPPGWALIGGVLTFIIFGINHYWMQSYWGGAVPAFGACLVIGGAFRTLRKIRRERYVWPLCVGIAIMFLSRPFEGLALTLAVGLILGASLWRRRERVNRIRLVVPCLVVSSGVMAFQAYYDWRVTGSPFTFPYTVHERTYAPVPTFWFFPLRADVPRPSDPIIYSLHWRWEMTIYNSLHEMPLWRRLIATTHRAYLILALSFGVFLNVLWLVPVFWSDTRVRNLALMTAPVIVATTLVVWGFAHYLAPAVPAIIALIFVIIQKLRSLETRPGTRTGTLIGGLALVIMAGFACEQRPNMRLAGFGFSHLDEQTIGTVSGAMSAARDRDNLIARLQHTGEKHLIIVHYSSNPPSCPDWVHNSANIDAQSVIWARDRGDEENQRLISYYHSRHVWMMRSSGASYTLGPYDDSSSVSSEAQK